MFVVGMDGSSVAKSALAMALALSSSRDAVYVVGVATPETNPSSKHHPKRVLQKTELALLSSGIDYQLVYVSAKPGSLSSSSPTNASLIAAGILGVAEAVQCDLVVTGSRGLASTVFASSGASDSLGSVAAACVAGAVGSVAVVKNEKNEMSAEAVVAVSIDGSPVSLRAVRLGAAMAKPIGASLHVCSVTSSSIDQDALRTAVADVLHLEDDSDASFAAADVDYAVLPRVGTVAGTVVEHLSPMRPLASLICTSRTRRSTNILGSNSKRILFKAPFNVVLIKPTDDDA